MSEPKISIRGLCKSFGSKTILRNLDLDVPAGKSLVVIGGSGTGKSVLLKCVLGLLEPDAGTIAVDGKDLRKVGSSERRELLSQFGMLFQGAALFDSLLVWQNISFAAKGLSKKQAKELAVEKLQSVGLAADVADRYPAELSGGMQKRVGLARAIALNPAVIFFDEPTTGLDPIMANVINQLIVKSTKDLGATALSITHDMDSARIIADRVAMLYEGKIIWQGDVRDLQMTDNDHVRQFVEGRRSGPIPIAV